MPTIVGTAAASRRPPRLADVFSATVDVVCIQHEFGIFGGDEGAELCELTDRLRVPYTLTLHTVLHDYSPAQRAALAGPLAGAARVLVFTDEAIALVAAQFPEVGPRCRVVPHGAPVELYRPADEDGRAQLGLPDVGHVVTTFGLLSPGKGIERAIRAMVEVRRTVEGAVLVIAGQTHPGVVRRSGEAYRRSLEALAREARCGRRGGLP